MDSTELAARLAALPALVDIPRSELEWIAEHGELVDFETGSLIARKGERIEHLWIILEGRMAVYRDTPAGRQKVMEWGPGEVSGRLPYSRMTEANVDVRLDEATDAFGLHERHHSALVNRCEVFTEHCVHLMVDRVRRFKATELQAEKLVSLGRLSAGLAHELNNPASATVRGAAALREGLAETEAASRALVSAGLTDEDLVRLEQVRADCVGAPGGGVLSALEQADRETELEEWLEDHGCDPDHAAALAETRVGVHTLDRLAEARSGGALEASIRWLAATCATHSVASEIEGAARRIHELVAAVKRFTYMDNLTATETVDVTVGLGDTVTVLAAKARGKGASVKLDIVPELPAVRARGGELNQVWMNLLDNALDAIAEGGTVTVGVAREGSGVAVRIVDDGPGIPPEIVDHIFDPFFTTKGPGDGTGLGLDIARKIVRQNGGAISVESRPGHTEFRVLLPVDGGPQ